MVKPPARSGRGQDSTTNDRNSPTAMAVGERWREPVPGSGGLCGQAISQAGLQSRRTTQTRSRFAIRASSPSAKPKDGAIAPAGLMSISVPKLFPTRCLPLGDRSAACGGGKDSTTNDRNSPTAMAVGERWREPVPGSAVCAVRRSRKRACRVAGPHRPGVASRSAPPLLLTSRKTGHWPG